MYTNLNKRFLAFIIDVFLIYCLSYIGFFVLDLMLDFRNIMLCSGFISLFYFILFWVKFHGRTPATFFLGIQLVSDDGNSVTFKNAFLRAGALFTFIAPVGIIIFLTLLNIIETLVYMRKSPYKENKQTVWDVFSHTYVVEGKRRGKREKGKGSDPKKGQSDESSGDVSKGK